MVEHQGKLWQHHPMGKVFMTVGSVTVHISFIHCVDVNFNFSLLIFRQEGTTESMVYAVGCICCNYPWWETCLDLSRLAPLATEWQLIKVWRKWCFWQAHSESIQNFHIITMQNLNDASFMSNKMEEEEVLKVIKHSELKFLLLQ